MKAKFVVVAMCSGLFLFAAAARAADPGNTLGTALDIGPLNGQQVLTGTVGPGNTDDFYRFTNTVTSIVNATLNGTGTSAGVELIRDANTNGVVNPGDIWASLPPNCASAPTAVYAKSVGVYLAAGVYYAHVFQTGCTSAYTLTLVSDAAGNRLRAARNIGDLNAVTPQQFTDFVGSSDPNDFYRFRLSAPSSSVTITLTGLSADANVELIRDINGNGVVDPGEVLATSTNPGTANESINVLLPAGTYYVRVYQASGNGNYTLTLSVP